MESVGVTQQRMTMQHLTHFAENDPGRNYCNEVSIRPSEYTLKLYSCLNYRADWTLMQFLAVNSNERLFDIYNNISQNKYTHS